MDPNRFFEMLADVPNLRSVQFTDVEMVASGNEFRFDGIAAPTGVTADLGDFTEEYKRGSFRRYLASNKTNIPFLHEHNPRDLLATTRSGRLKLSEDGPGLRSRANIVKTDLSERVKSLVDSGDIAGMSIGMIVGRDNAQIEHRNGKPHRLITNFRRILDVCTTFDPAYVSTEAQFRSMSMQYAETPDDWQRLLSGAYPQLAEPGQQNGDSDGELRTTVEQPDEDAPSGVADAQRLAAAKRRMQFALLLTGDHDAS